jgi:hypothetical protein
MSTNSLSFWARKCWDCCPWGTFSPQQKVSNNLEDGDGERELGRSKYQTILNMFSQGEATSFRYIWHHRDDKPHLLDV